MNDQTEEEEKEKKIAVGVNLYKSELAEMQRVTCVDLSGPAVLAMARKGLAAEKEKESMFSANREA